MSAPLGILGGSFDPVHNAHLALAREARAALGLQSVRWMPSGRPGHREPPRASDQDRLAMLHLAVPEGDTVDDAEMRSAEPTYTVNTLTRLRAELGAAVPFVFLIGADQLQALDRWREWTRLFELTHFGVAQRPGYALAPDSLPAAVANEVALRRGGRDDVASQPAGRIVLFPMAPQDVSSTAIRASLAAGRSPGESIPPAVLAYIETRRLYRA